MNLNEDNNIKRRPLLDIYIQRVINEQMQEVDEIMIAKRVRELLKDGEIETKNLN